MKSTRFFHSSTAKKLRNIKGPRAITIQLLNDLSHLAQLGGLVIHLLIVKPFNHVNAHVQWLYIYSYNITTVLRGRTQHVSYNFQGVFEGGLENVSLHFEGI
jgi:hypothetical protein